MQLPHAPWSKDITMVTCPSMFEGHCMAGRRMKTFFMAAPVSVLNKVPLVSPNMAGDSSDVDLYRSTDL